MSHKSRFDLVPFSAIGEIADVLEYGANKYEANNWCRGARWSRYFSALCRHVFAWWRGEDKDPETGFSHLAHAGCCLVFLMEYQRNDWGTDDRFRGPDGGEFIKHDGRCDGGREISRRLHLPAQQCCVARLDTSNPAIYDNDDEAL